ncbi:Polyvinylalcohol dehydrogenase [Vitis vinifera]|uniref:Polyvinylalcohol dehydrogenase n=1 Tax=Vitis vinifera TaxID=29760 RepID=A0A438HD04_VITVI|nr:Polyvinylalcohol dehydrogenase [Vitis vinifera]
MELPQNQNNGYVTVIISVLVLSGFTVMDLADAVLKWKFFTGDDTTATPAVADGVVYFPSWNGYLYAVNAFNGALVWRRHLGELTGLSPIGIVVNVTVSRTTPAVDDDLIVIGIYGPAVVVAVNRLKGTLVWSTVLDPHPRSQITMSGTPYSGNILVAGIFYIGVSSLEEALPPKQCCTFRGGMAKLDIGTGEVLWRTYMIPDNGGQIGGYSGAALWGSSPAIDIKRGLVYIGTGNLYNAPAEVLEYQARQNNQTTPSQPDQCIDDPNVHFDSILALELDTGKIRRFRRFEEYDVNYFACLVPNNPACPPGPNLDADFGEAPMLLTIFSNSTKRDVVVAVQKSGYAWALDRDSGDIVWFNVRTKTKPYI